MVDYSKWKDIEISDDEDDTHPNIDTPSLCRWRHQARVERMAESDREKEILEKAKLENRNKALEIQRKLRESENCGEADLSSLKLALSELEQQQKDFQEKEEALAKKEKLTPWNVDTISRAGFSKTIINNPKRATKEELSEEEQEAKQRKFIEENEKLLKKYGMLRKFEDSKAYLQEHPHLACEEATNYLVIWCINLEVEEKHELMGHVAHQVICLQYILELGKQLEVDPRACISSFFSRIQIADKQYIDSFEDELKMFKERVRQRAKARLDKAIKEVEEEERQERLGPGGLDPLEVLESLPESLKKCFEEQDIPMLQRCIAEMNEEEARYHMKRCVDSGLWVPDARTGLGMAESGTDATKSETSKEGDKA